MGMFPDHIVLVRSDQNYLTGEQTGLWAGADSEAVGTFREKELKKQRELMARKRAEGREVHIPEVGDLSRRSRCRYDLTLFCKTYFPELFYLEMAPMHYKIIRENQDSILHGGKIALAAPRGYGKTTITLISIIWAVVYGHAKYIVLVCAEKTQARSRLEDLKESFQDANSLLAEDFPEVCAPVIDLQGASQRASKQLVLWPETGHKMAEKMPTNLKWELDRVRFARVPSVTDVSKPADCSGTIVVCKGADAAIRGLVKGRLRPDLVLLDDPQTDESARSPKQTEDREKIIRKSIEGLVGPGHALTILSLWTVIEAGDLADKFTSDREPDFRSLRFRAMEVMPANMELVEEYSARLRDAQRSGDVSGRAAHAWYLLNRDSIEAGAKVGWEQNFVAWDVGDQNMREAVEPPHLDSTDQPANGVRLLKSGKRLQEARAAAAELLAKAKSLFCLDPDALKCQDCASCTIGAGDEEEGKPACPLRMREISAIQAQLNKRAMDSSEGHANWEAEYQNNPPERKRKIIVPLTEAAIYNARSGLLQRVVPADAEIIVQGRDVGRYWIHTTTMAISPRRVCRVIDYYKTPVESPRGLAAFNTPEGKRKQQHIEAAVWTSLQELAKQDNNSRYSRKTEEGEIVTVPITLTCVDSRWPMEVVRRHCFDTGDSHVPCMGRGTNDKHKWAVPRDAEKARRRRTSQRDMVYLTHDGQCYSKCNSIGMTQSQHKYLWCYYAHSDWYKSTVHAGLLLDPGEPGSISVFDGISEHGEIMQGALFEQFHKTYAHHITAEEEQQDRPGSTKWVKAPGRDDNHYFDATYLALVALSILEHIYESVQVDPSESTVTTPAPLTPAAKAVKQKTWLEKRPDRPGGRKRGSWASRRKRRSG
jgi:hypothetical protein